MTSWNAFLFPLIVFQGESQWTLPLGVMNFWGSHRRPGPHPRIHVLSLIPAVLFYVVAEQHIVGGSTAGSVKG